MDSTFSKRAILSYSSASGTGHHRYGWHISNDDAVSFSKDELRTCDPLRLNEQHDYLSRFRHPTQSREGHHILQDSQNQASHLIEKQHKQSIIDDEPSQAREDIDKEDQNKTKQFNSSDDEIRRRSNDTRRKCHLDTRCIIDQSQANPFSSKERHHLSENHYHPHRMMSHHRGKARFLSQPSLNLTHISTRCHTVTAEMPRCILVVIFLNAILNHLTHIIHHGNANGATMQLFAYPNIVKAEIVNECVTDGDCPILDKICYENKCICKRARPIEDKENSACLPHASLNEGCSMVEQCIGNSVCTDGYCVCPLDHISIFNPSTKLHYCHPKRGLNEECNYDSQCPDNSFCSTKKHGCLCQNGFGATLVKDSNGIETRKCLPKLCQTSSDCETEYYICDENKCKCLATHFDPHTAGCYKFGSTGGSIDEPAHNGNITILEDKDLDGGFTSIINDLMKNGDKLWLIVIILAVLTLIFLAILIILLRKYYLGYCWTHTKEYEPNNENSSRNGQFNKNSINNKSFRKKSGELDDDEEAGSGISDDTAADKSNLVTKTGKQNGALINDSTAFVKLNGSDNENHYVQVDMRGTSNADADEDNQRSHKQIITRPLPSSTSTPV